MSNAYEKKKIPRVIKRHKESPYTDYNSPWYRITTYLGTIASLPVYRLVQYEDPRYTQYALAITTLSIVYIWYEYCGISPLKAKRTWHHFWHCVDKLLGKNSFNRLTTGLSWWERLLGRKMSVLYPVDKIYDDGLVQFNNGHWVRYADLNPKKTPDENKPNRSIKMQAVVDGMYSGQMVKFVTTTRSNPRKAVVNYLLQLSFKITDRVRAMHLNSIIQMLLKKNKTPMVKRHYVMIGLGVHSSYEDALLANDSWIPSMIENLSHADLEPELLMGEQVEKLLREASSETVVL